MKTRQIEIVNKTKTENLKHIFINWLIKQEITVDGLINCCMRKKIIIPASVINSIGIAYSQGKETIKKNPVEALKLYLFAADHLNSGKASGNCAHYYFDGRAGSIDLEKAYVYCKKAISLKETKHFLMAKILCKKGSYAEAILLFDQVKNKKEQTQAMQHKKELFNRYLQEIYQKLDASDTVQDYSTEMEAEDSVTEEMEESETSENLPGWYAISELMDGFDKGDCGQLSTKIIMVQLQLNIIEASIELANKQYKNNEALEEESEALIEERNKFATSLKLLKSKKNELDEHHQAYSSSADNTIRRQYQTECHFFNPRRTKKVETLQLALQLEARRLSDACVEEAIVATNIPARRIITAERSTVETSIALLRLHEKYNYVESGWTSNPAVQRTTNTHYSSYHQNYTFDETVKIGESEVHYRQRSNPHVNHLGDFYNCDLGDYAAILKILNLVTGTNAECVAVKNEMQLANYMIRFCREGKPITFEELMSINELVNEDHAHQLNQIFYHCFIKEVASWMLPRDRSHQLPLATAQSRALQLIASGYLSIQEVFAKGAHYGVYTGSNIGKDENLPILRAKIVRINVLYNKVMLEHHPDHFSAYALFFKNHSAGEIIPTREALHQELKKTFGGSDSETDGEGYETDEERHTHYRVILNSI